MNDVGKNLDDLLLHYGVKGMKWKSSNGSDNQITSEQTSAGGGGQSPEEHLNEIGAKLDEIKGKVGDGPLDILKYIITGKTKNVDKTNNSQKGKVSSDLDVLGAKIKSIRSKVGNGPMDMLKYILTGKKQITHSGTKGMHWGVRRDIPSGPNDMPDVKGKPIRTTLGKKLHSLKRERQWNSVLKEMDNLSTKDITEVARRVSLENSLKMLSRSKVGTKKDKEDYLRREHMDNQELSRKVVRLRAKEGLHSAVKSASKEQRDFGQKVMQIGGSLGVKYALTRTRPSAKEIIDVFKNPKSSADKAQADVLKVVMDKLKSQNSNQ